jgi:hypothetical protein
MAALSHLDPAEAAKTDPRPLALLRIVVGLNALLCGVETWSNFSAIVRPEGLRIPFAPFLAPLPADWFMPFMVVWFALAALLTLGCWTKTAGAVLASQMAYVLLVDQQTYSNHLYLLTLEVVFLVLGNAGACWSVDAWRRGLTESAPVWPITLWKIQISIVYVFAAAAKVNPGFLSGEVLAIYWPTEGTLSFLRPLREPMVLIPMAWMSVGVELFLALALWSRALRRLAVVLGIGLHLGMILLVSQKDPTGIVVFALATLPPYLLFFDWGTIKQVALDPALSNWGTPGTLPAPRVQ